MERKSCPLSRTISTNVLHIWGERLVQPIERYSSLTLLLSPGYVSQSGLVEDVELEPLRANVFHTRVRVSVTVRVRVRVRAGIRLGLALGERGNFRVRQTQSPSTPFRLLYAQCFKAKTDPCHITCERNHAINMTERAGCTHANCLLTLR